jgi:hypothetical protein
VGSGVKNTPCKAGIPMGMLSNSALLRLPAMLRAIGYVLIISIKSSEERRVGTLGDGGGACFPFFLRISFSSFSNTPLRDFMAMNGNYLGADGRDETGDSEKQREGRSASGR